MSECFRGFIIFEKIVEMKSVLVFTACLGSNSIKCARYFRSVELSSFARLLLYAIPVKKMRAAHFLLLAKFFLNILMDFFKQLFSFSSLLIRHTKRYSELSLNKCGESVKPDKDIFNDL